MLNKSDTSPPLDVLVIGSGSMGSAIAGLAARNGKLNVGLVGRHHASLSLRSSGLKINIDSGTRTFFEIKTGENLQIFSDLNKEYLLTMNPRSIVVVATKTPDLESAVQGYFRRIIYESGERAFAASDPRNDPVVLLIQNGLYPELHFKKILSQNDLPQIRSRVIGVVPYGTADLTEVPEPVVDYIPGSVVLGSWDNDLFDQVIHDDALTQMKSVFGSESPLRVAGKEEYQQLRYERAIINSANSLSAIFRIRIGDLVSNIYLKHFLDQKIKECIEVYNRITESDQMKHLDVLHGGMSIYTSMLNDQYTSMAKDLFDSLDKPLRPVRTEVDHLDLAFAAEGQARGVNVQYNEYFGNLVSNFANRFNGIREVSVDLAKEFGRKFLDWNRIAIGLEPFYDRNAHLAIMDELVISKTRADRLDLISEVYSSLIDHYSPIRSS